MISHCSLYGIIYVLFFEFFLNVDGGGGYDVASSQEVLRGFCLFFLLVVCVCIF